MSFEVDVENDSDGSNGNDVASREFISGRTRSGISVSIVRQWAKALLPGGNVLSGLGAWRADLTSTSVRGFGEPEPRTAENLDADHLDQTN